MKKLFTSLKWKQQSRRRQIASAKKAQRRKRHNKIRSIHGERRRAQQRLSRWRANRPLKTITSPRELSMVRDPDGVIQLLNRIGEEFSNDFNVFLDLTDLQEISSDAVAVLLLFFSDSSFTKRMRIQGSFPSDPNALAKLIDAGFFNTVFNERFAKKPRTTARWKDKNAKIVDPDIANNLMTEAASSLCQRPATCPAVYTVLIECMANTKNHASDKPEGDGERWRVTKFDNDEPPEVIFSFVDAGVGILRSKNVGTIMARFASGVKRMFQSDVEILRAIMRGEIESSTGLLHRGEGLVEIFELCTKYHEISELVIIANEAYFNAETDEARTLKAAFPGTFIHWAIRKDQCSYAENN